MRAANRDLCLLLVVHANLIRTLEPGNHFLDPVDVDQVSLSVATSGPTVTNFKLLDITGGSSVQVGTTQPIATSSAVTFNFLTNPQQIGAGQTKTYELIATVSGWAQYGTLSIGLVQDTVAAAQNDQELNVISNNSGQNNIIWSDRSATGHSTTTTDWTNGYLLKNFVNDVTSYTHN